MPRLCLRGALAAEGARFLLSAGSRLIHAFGTVHRQFKEIDYPKPDGKLSFVRSVPSSSWNSQLIRLASQDILESVSRTNTYHAEDQPVHLHIEPSARAAHVKTNVKQYAGLLGRVCPAAVYEYVDAEGTEEDAEGKRLVINSQNCIHCKVRGLSRVRRDVGLC